MVWEGAVVAVGVGVTYGNDGRGEFAGSDEAFIAVVSGFKRFASDDDAEGEDSVGRDGGNFGGVEIGFEVATF